MHIVMAIFLLFIMTVMLPVMDGVWTNALLPLIDSTPGITSYEDVLWRYFPYIITAFFLFGVFMIIKRKSSDV